LEETEARSITDAEARLLQTVNECRSKIAEPLHAFARKLGRSKTVMPMVEALYELLVTLRVPERLEQWSQAALRSGALGTAKEHAGVWDRVIDMLDQLVEMMGEEPISMELFAGLIETGLESIRLGLVPPAVDQVLVGSMDRTRTDGVKRLFLLGVSEGVIPSKLNEDGLLTEAEREKLAQSGLRLAESSRRRLLDEQFLIYNALCTPSEHLWLSYPLADEEGKSLLPSDLIRQVKQLFPSVKEAAAWVEPPADDTAIQLSFLAQPDRALTHLAVQLKQAANGAAVAPIWWDVYNWFARTDRERLRPLLQSLHYTNREQPLHPPTSRELYGSHLKTSVSRMERFVACPFSQFISHGLRLDERRVYRLEAPDIGQLFHAALSQFADRLAEEQLDWGSLTPEHCAERASQVVDELAPRLQSEILLSSKRYHYIAGKLKATISRAASVLGEHSRRSTFAPVGTEVGFGPEQQLPALQYKLQGGATMEVIGRIDRVDRTVTDRGTLLRVIDYKSSQTSLQLASVYHGLSLQMLTYLDVVLTYAEHWIGTEALPAGVLYFHVHNPIIQRKNAVPPEKARAELNKRFKMKGLLLADEETVRRMDSGLEGRSGYSELVPAALKADGGFYKTSSVATEPQWNALRRYVRKAISSIGSEIAAGNVDIAPYRMGKKAACTMCSYRPVCQFDPLVEGNDYRQLPQLGKDFVWELIERSASEEEFKR
jgi:ATP-dependent helicase/nuclease subunit B